MRNMKHKLDNRSNLFCNTYSIKSEHYGFMEMFMLLPTFQKPQEATSPNRSRSKIFKCDLNSRQRYNQNRFYSSFGD